MCYTLYSPLFCSADESSCDKRQRRKTNAESVIVIRIADSNENERVPELHAAVSESDGALLTSRPSDVPSLLRCVESEEVAAQYRSGIHYRVTTPSTLAAVHCAVALHSSLSPILAYSSAEPSAPLNLLIGRQAYY